MKKLFKPIMIFEDSVLFKLFGRLDQSFLVWVLIR